LNGNLKKKQAQSGKNFLEHKKEKLRKYFLFFFERDSRHQHKNEEKTFFL